MALFKAVLSSLGVGILWSLAVIGIVCLVLIGFELSEDIV